MRTLRVGVNLLYLKPGQVGGTEEYVRRVIDAMDDGETGGFELTLFVNRRFRTAHPDLAERHRTVVAPIAGDHPAVRVLAESTWLARSTTTRPLDLVHHLANTMPHLRTRPAVVTIHDLQPIVRPQDFGRVKGMYLRRRLGPAARRARVVTTPSLYVRELVVERFAVDPSRVIVVPAPLEPPKAPPPSDGGAARPGRDFVYPAITHPHKNHITLIRAFARVAEARSDPSLVLTGGRGEREEEVAREIDRLGLEHRVRRPGRIPRAELDSLIGRAAAVTFPSRHEGYGLPVAEAMALGCPVIASNATALPEVVGDAGLLVDPDDIEGWADAMLGLLDDHGRRAELVARGRLKVASLTPAETARRMVAAYRLALGDG